MSAKLTVVGKDQAAANKSSAAGRVTRSDGAYLRYVEDKPLDMAAVGEFLQDSQKANHWTNFGPVSLQAEAAIAEALNLDEGLRVVMCSSGTAALHGIIALHETLAKRDLRWVSSSFGYYSSVQGPLRHADIADCDEQAMLDLDTLDPTKYDGLIVTNTFGQAGNLDKYYRFAATHGKILCIDSALAFGSHKHGANECISFHHTKPWGFGEGGCAIVAAEHEQLLRSLICFGHEEGEEINRRADNGKISDIAAAFALMRLQQMDSKADEYREQYRRIASLGRQVGFAILADVDQHPGIPANVPLLAPVALQDFKHKILPTGRYYHPLANTPTANEIYERIVNVPCHSDLAKLSDAEIRNALNDIIQRCF
ncbi:MAG: DegT/DnrJ/EryC1/StrS family aminotransferase [Agarilytica sp.]